MNRVPVKKSPVTQDLYGRGNLSVSVNPLYVSLGGVRRAVRTFLLHVLMVGISKAVAARKVLVQPQVGLKNLRRTEEVALQGYALEQTRIF
tara:strand:+ start:151 stop:423 length:273 start_codon:yes stop_codon:yes gene_type:complete